MPPSAELLTQFDSTDYSTLTGLQARAPHQQSARPRTCRYRSSFAEPRRFRAPGTLNSTTPKHDPVAVTAAPADRPAMVSFGLNGEGVPMRTGSLLDALRDEARMPLGQGRVQSTRDSADVAPSGRRGTSGRLCHACQARGGSRGHDTRGTAGGTTRSLGRCLRRARRQPVWLLHARPRDAPGLPRGEVFVAQSAGGRRATAWIRQQIRQGRPRLCRCRMAIDRRRRRRRTRHGARASRPVRPVTATTDHVTSCSHRGARRSRAGSQSSGPEVVLGGGVADDTAPPSALFQLGADRAAGPRDAPADGHRPGAGAQQHRHALSYPVAPPAGEWALTLATTWVEPAYVEPDASWCRPGRPATHLRRPAAARSAASGRVQSPPEAGANRRGRRAGASCRLCGRVRRGPKRPPLGLALRADGGGVVRVGRTPGSADLAPLVERVRELSPDLHVEVVDVTGPPVGSDLRGAGWAEVLAALHVCHAMTAEAAPSDPSESSATRGSGRADVTCPWRRRAVVVVAPATVSGARSTSTCGPAARSSRPVGLRSYAGCGPPGTRHGVGRCRGRDPASRSI